MARSAGTAVVGAAIGAFGWTATEYATHRFVLHGPFGKGKGALSHIPLGGLHRAHHRAPMATCVQARIAGHLAIASVAVAASSVLTGALPALGARTAAAVWALGYSCYELNHWNFHHKPARTAWGERQRQRHDRHHFGAPHSNHGVTIGFWDRLLKTEAPPRQAVPASTVAA